MLSTTGNQKCKTYTKPFMNNLDISGYRDIEGEIPLFNLFHAKIFNGASFCHSPIPAYTCKNYYLKKTLIQINPVYLLFTYMHQEYIFFLIESATL